MQEIFCLKKCEDLLKFPIYVEFCKTIKCDILPIILYPNVLNKKLSLLSGPVEQILYELRHINTRRHLIGGLLQIAIKVCDYLQIFL